MKKTLTIAVLAVLAIGFSACEKYLDDKYENPNLVKQAPINPLLATATHGTALNAYRLGYNISYLTQYQASSSQGSDADIYNEVDYSGTWSNFYNTMMNISEMNKLAEKNSAYYHLGVGKVLMAYNLNMLITAFGEVPYSEGFQGLDELTPAYDDQETLHSTTLQLLTDAIASLERTDALAEIDRPSDVIHGGNVAAWLKTAHALKARFLNQLSKKPGYNATAIFAELDDAYKLNSDDAALIAFDGLSPWNAVAVDNANLNLDGWLSTNIVNAMNGTTYGVSDPRLPLIASITKFGDYRGTRNGAGRIGTGTDDEESYLSLNGFYSKGGAPLQLVTFAEMKFIEAEAAFRSGDKDKAYNAYLKGIEANMDKIGVEAADKQAYISNAVVSVGKDNITLKLIFKEKYVAMMLNTESWVDMRRCNYDYTGFQMPLNVALPDFIRRFAYPSVEISRNGPNVPEVSGLDEKLWWDQ